MGWQGKDPSTDFRYGISHFEYLSPSNFLSLKSFSFHVIACIWHMSYHVRGGGFISLENLLYFARNFPVWSHTLSRTLFCSANACSFVCGTFNLVVLSFKWIYIHGTYASYSFVWTWTISLSGSVITLESCNWFKWPDKHLGTLQFPHYEKNIHVLGNWYMKMIVDLLLD